MERPAEIHERKGRDQRHRNGDDRNEGGAEGMQEDEDDERHQNDGFHDSGEHVVIERSMKTVESNPTSTSVPSGSEALMRGRTALTALATSSGLATACLTMPMRNGGIAFIAAFAPHVGGGEFDPGHVAQHDLQATGVLQLDLARILPAVPRAGARQHGEFALGAFDAARRNFGVLARMAVSTSCTVRPSPASFWWSIQTRMA